MHERKNHFVPTDQEVNDLVADSPLILATLLQLIKEVGPRIGEALRLKWIDVDFEKCIISLNEPEKDSDPRIFKNDSSPRLMDTLNGLPRIDERVFGGRTRNSLENTLGRVRAKLASKLHNPRLRKIHFHALRYLALTMY